MLKELAIKEHEIQMQFLQHFVQNLMKHQQNVMEWLLNQKFKLLQQAHAVKPRFLFIFSYIIYYFFLQIF